MRRLATILVLMSMPLGKAGAEVRIKTENGQIVGLSGLFKDKGYYPASIQGRVVKRDFDADGIRLKGFVMEDADGTRSFVNIEIPDIAELGRMD